MIYVLVKSSAENTREVYSAKDKFASVCLCGQSRTSQTAVRFMFPLAHVTEDVVRPVLNYSVALWILRLKVIPTRI